VIERSVLGAIVAAGLWLLPLFACIAVLHLSRRWWHERDRRNPLTRGLLRGPGHSLREQANDLRFDLLLYPTYFSALPVVTLAALSMIRGTAGLRLLDWILVGLVTLFVVAFAGYKIIRLTRKLRDLGLGFEAETSIGQELNLLMMDGFSVFHDVSGDQAFNVDHVVVGPQGVFAVETKGRSKPVRNEGVETHRLQYDGKQLLFPGWTETKPLEQARRNADWLRKWLTSAVGTAIDVKPVLMIPGWFIDRTSPPGMAVMNGTNCRNFFVKSRDAQLSEQLVKQIVHQLDARCRDVEPTTYKPLKKS